MQSVLQSLQDEGVQVEEVTLENWDGEEIKKAFYDRVVFLMGAFMDSALSRQDVDQLCNYNKHLLDICGEMTPADTMRAYMVEGQMAQTFGTLFQKYDAFICPTCATPHIPADFDAETQTLTIDGHDQVDQALCGIMTFPFNILHRLPVLNMPSGQTQRDMPTGIQIVAAPYKDDMVFHIGMCLEEVRGQFFAADHLPVVA